MMVLRLRKPIWSNSRKAPLADCTASSRLSNTPSSPDCEGTPARSLGAGPGRFTSAAMRWAMASISWSVRPVTSYLVLLVLVHAADFPAIHDGHDDGVAGAI